MTEATEVNGTECPHCKADPVDVLVAESVDCIEWRCMWDGAAWEKVMIEDYAGKAEVEYRCASCEELIEFNWDEGIVY